MSESTSSSSDSGGDPTKSYEGSCHCGAVKFTAKLDLSKPVMACNCSICSREGWLLTFVPASAVEVSGKESLTDYQFGKKHLHHEFCKVCGVHPFSHGEDPSTQSAMYGINVRCIPDLDATKLEMTHYDGKNH